jgi:hypothetical protein
MRISILAQSQLSVPPAPAVICKYGTQLIFFAAEHVFELQFFNPVLTSRKSLLNILFV